MGAYLESYAGKGDWTAAAITPVERKYHAKENSSLLDVVKPLVGQACALEGGLSLSLLKTQYGQIVCENNSSAVVAVLRLLQNYIRVFKIFVRCMVARLSFISHNIIIGQDLQQFCFFFQRMLLQ